MNIKFLIALLILIVTSGMAANTKVVTWNNDNPELYYVGGLPSDWTYGDCVTGTDVGQSEYLFPHNQDIYNDIISRVLKLRDVVKFEIEFEVDTNGPSAVMCINPDGCGQFTPRGTIVEMPLYMDQNITPTWQGFNELQYSNTMTTTDYVDVGLTKQRIRYVADVIPTEDTRDITTSCEDPFSSVITTSQGDGNWDFGQNFSDMFGAKWRISQIQAEFWLPAPNAPVITGLAYIDAQVSGDTMPRIVALSGRRDISDPETIHKNFKFSYTITHTPVDGGQQHEEISGDILFALDIPDNQADFDTILQLPFLPSRGWPTGDYKISSAYLYDEDDARVPVSNNYMNAPAYTLNKPAPSIQSASLVNTSGKVLAFNLGWTPRYNSGELVYNSDDEIFEAANSQFQYRIWAKDGSAESDPVEVTFDEFVEQNNVQHDTIITVASSNLYSWLNGKMDKPVKVFLQMAWSGAENWNTPPIEVGTFTYSKVNLGPGVRIAVDGVDPASWDPKYAVTVSASETCDLYYSWDLGVSWSASRINCLMQVEQFNPING
jgi:hypothetical protein